jgi:hypothetical protein
MGKTEYCRKIKSDLLSLLGLPLELQEDNLEKLIVLSIKQQLQGSLSQEVMIQITKKDCHQIDLVIQKKVLAVMALERMCRMELSEVEYQNLSTVHDICTSFLKQEGKDV